MIKRVHTYMVYKTRGRDSIQSITISTVSLGLFFFVLWHTNKFRDCHCIQVTESLIFVISTCCTNGPWDDEERSLFHHHHHHRTHIRYRSIRKLSIPPILHPINLPLLIQMNYHLALNHLFLANHLDRILGLKIHDNRISRVLDLVADLLNLAKRRLQAVPLGGVFASALGNG